MNNLSYLLSFVYGAPSLFAATYNRARENMAVRKFRPVRKVAGNASLM